MVIEHAAAKDGYARQAGPVTQAAPGFDDVAGGVCMLFDAETLADSPVAAEQARQQVFDVLVQGLDLSVSLRTSLGGCRAHAALSVACEILANAAADAGASAAALPLVIDNPAIRPEQAAAIRRSILGNGRVYMVAPDAALRAPTDRSPVGDRFWQELWNARAGTTLRVAYARPVRASSSLLRSEAATAVLPRSQIEVPAGTAWVRLRIDLAGFHDGVGLCESSLERALRACVEQGERAHDELCWATAQMRDDAWLNRRLAIAVYGLGDLVVKSGRDPEAFSTLEYLAQLLTSVRRVARACTRTIAARTANLPALEQTDPCRFLPPGEVRDAWRRRWSEMMVTAAVRHRNLLVLSPWSIFPAGQPADFRYANLLPILRFADTCMLSGMPDLCQWRVGEYRAFHCRASAALQQRESRHQIAEGC